MNTMESKLHKTAKGFFPNYFKLTGVGILIIPFLLGIFYKITNNVFLLKHSVLIKTISPTIFILGLFIIVFSKDKNEDELYVFLRLKAFASAVGAAAIMVIIRPIIDLLFMDPLTPILGQEIVIFMLLMHLMVYYLLKRRI